MLRSFNETKYAEENQKKLYMWGPVLMPHEAVVLTTAASLQTLLLTSLSASKG
jgi:hypothetical protein